MRNSQRSDFSTGQPSQQSFIRAQLLQSGISPSRQQQHQRFAQPNEFYNTSNNMAQQQQQTRMLNTGLQNSTLQQFSNIPTASSSPTVPTVKPNDGYYTIIKVHSAAEFYGLSQNRENELNSLFKHLADYYNNAPNDSSLNVSLFPDGTLCVIQEGDKYHRVIITRRETESRVSVKLVDRGDEIIVDTSELLQIDNKSASIPTFAQPFRLRGYDELQSSANITFHLKKLILNQRVQISQCGQLINGFYPVEVILNNNQSVNRMLLSNDKNLSITSPSSNTRPNFNQPPPTHIESQVFSNSTRHHPTIGHDLSGRLDMGQRTNDVLPAPQKILTGPARTQPGRFGATANQIPSSGEQISRFSNVNNRNQQQSQPIDSTSSNSVWNKDQNNKSSFPGSNVVNQQTFGRQQLGSSQFGMNQRTDDNKISQNRFGSNNSDNQQSSFEQKRSFGGGYSHDDRNERQTSGNNFQQNNNGTNESSGFQRGSFSNRGRFGDRGGRGGFNDRNMGRNNEDNENSSQSSGGFSKRTGGFGDRGGAHGGNFQDRNGTNRNQGDDYNENSTQRSQNFNSNRSGFRGGRGRGGGFQNHRDQGENGDSGRRGGRGGSRGGGFHSSRGGFRDRDNSGVQLSSDNTGSTKQFSGWTATRSISANFEAADRFIESEIPKETFKFVVSHVETANDFFIQLLSKGDELSKLSETLQNEYTQSPEINLSLLKINQPCLAKSSDLCWYRAIVLSTGLSKLKVRFIDFGDTTDVDSNTIRQIAKKYCSPGPYAYQCTFNNAQVVENVNRESIINKCAGKEFSGKIQTKTSDGKFLLESDDFLNLLLEINAIKLNSEITLKRIKCLIGYIESEKQAFYIQDDEDTLEKIADLVMDEEPNAPILSLDEVKQLELKTMVIARFEDDPFRGIITQSNESNENLDIHFVDYGNTSSCPKNSLKRCSKQLSSYPYQAKHCHLYGVSSNEIDNALKYLNDNTNPDNTLEISIINEKDQIYNVLVYINNQCINEKFGYDPNSIPSNDQSSTTESTTVKEEEQANEQVPSTNEISLDTSEVIKLETEKTPPKYRQALLTHNEKDKPYVYLQLYPESESIMDRINELIGNIIHEDKHNSSYKIGDHIVAKFTEDENYYRARIESYSPSTELYTVYFLDYGNIDENIPIDHLYSYSDDLNEIEPQARGYLLDEINPEIWNEIVRPLVEKNLNDIVEFYFTDENNSIIHLKFDNENEICHDTKENFDVIKSPIIEQNKTFQANITAIDNDCFYIHILPDGNLHTCEMEEILQTCDKQHKHTWKINDLCIVSNEENKYYRGEILAINDNKYDVKCIDYGSIFQNITDDHLYVLPDEEIFKKSSLAHQCRLYNVDDVNQVKAIEEIIKNIQPTERVTITVENDRNDQCLFVTLVRENNEIVNEQYSFDGSDTTENENKQESDNEKENEIIKSDSSDSAFADTANNDEQQLTSQNENTNQSNDPINITEDTNRTNITENNSLLSITNNQTIDFGENDPSTTIKDETNNSISSN